jgi:mRNA-degrading endonuclease RelE of RelBE toxin-antitoxin system
MNTTKIIESVGLDRFNEILPKCKDNIHVSPHALDHLSDAQRKLFKADDLIRILTGENPRGVGLQRNGRYAVFFRRKEGFWRIIVNFENAGITVITFLITDTMPNLKRIKNESQTS